MNVEWIILLFMLFFLYRQTKNDSDRLEKKIESQREAERKAKLESAHKKNRELLTEINELKALNEQIKIDYTKFTKSKLYFYKFTQTKKGIVTSTIPKHKIDNHPTLKVKFGFTAIEPEFAAQMNVAVGDELPLEITEKAVVDGDGNVIPNLFWAH